MFADDAHARVANTPWQSSPPPTALASHSQDNCKRRKEYDMPPESEYRSAGKERLTSALTSAAWRCHFL